MRVACGMLFGALALGPTQTRADPWVDTGMENGRHILVSLGGVPARPTAPFSASLAAVPADWPANGSAYEMWIAEFDCEARSRKIAFRIAYSGRRDPVRSGATETQAEMASPAIASQLDVLCDADAAARGRVFNNVGEFTRDMRR